ERGRGGICLRGVGDTFQHVGRGCRCGRRGDRYGRVYPGERGEYAAELVRVSRLSRGLRGRLSCQLPERAAGFLEASDRTRTVARSGIGRPAERPGRARTGPG